MKNAIAKGVIVVKAAGNSGRDGPFNADVATAAGAITLASVGSSVGDPVDKKIIMSRFSSIGPVSGCGGEGRGLVGCWQGGSTDSLATTHGAGAHPHGQLST